MSIKRSYRHLGADLLELLGSMRFAVSLLSIICVASIIGTVLPQNAGMPSYLDQFGPFWFQLFEVFALWDVYNSPWFLLIMGFLVLSTTVCLIRNSPKYIRDARSFKEHIRASSLRAFPHRIDQDSPQPAPQLQAQVEQLLRRMGYQYRLRTDEQGSLIAAKKGSSNRLGYIFGHAAIVVICLGGLLDSQLPIRLQVWLQNKQPITENMRIADVPDSGRLAEGNLSYKAHLLIPEGGRGGHGLIDNGQGILVQPLPFDIELKKFNISYYSTGMPSDFQSEVRVIDKDSGDSSEATIGVNTPLHHRGVTIYQSSIDDGNSKVQLKGFPLTGARTEPFDVDGVVGQSVRLQLSHKQERNYRLDVTELRVMNVEDLSVPASPQPEAQALFSQVAAVSGSAGGKNNDHLTNIGPSIHYRLVDEQGQETEFVNYMQPVAFEDGLVFLAGVRDPSSGVFRYLRIPADENRSMQDFVDLRAAIETPSMVEQASIRIAQMNAQSVDQMSVIARAAQGALRSYYQGGFDAIVKNAPAEKHEQVLAFAVPLVQMMLTELHDMSREAKGLPPIGIEQLDHAEQWMHHAFVALGNLSAYPAPFLITLDQFEYIPASVFQITRSPGQAVVYLGSALLIIGVFTMFYIRNRQIWVWIQEQSASDNQGQPTDTGSHLMAAMTARRRNIDFEQEFQRFKDSIAVITQQDKEDKHDTPHSDSRPKT